MSEGATVHRVTGRVIPVDAEGNVLLLYGCDPARPQQMFWFTIGGAVDGEESTADAAAREAFEETGLVVAAADLGEAAWSEPSEFSFDGLRIRQENDFYVVVVPSYEPDLSRLEPVEQASVHGHGWWDIDDLAASDQWYFPTDLPDRLRKVMRR